MKKSKSKCLPEFKSTEGLVTFFETQDLGDYLDSMPAVHFDVSIQTRTHLFPLDAELANRLAAIARVKQISSTQLIETWLKEKLSQQV